MKYERRGFTLIEMLIVVSIIVLLVAMLLPALGKARQKAKQSVCISKISQLAVAWSNYTIDAKGRIMEYTLNSEHRALWTQLLRPYVGDDHALLICPETVDPPGYRPGEPGAGGYRMGLAKLAWVEDRSGYLAPDPFNRASYCYNGNIFSQSVYNSTIDRYGYAANIQAMGEVPLLGDGAWRSQTPGNGGKIKAFPTNLNDPTTGFTGYDSVARWVMNRHNETTNLVFLDGHAEPVPLHEMWSFKWSRTYETVDYLD